MAELEEKVAEQKKMIADLRVVLDSVLATFKHMASYHPFK